MSFNLIDSVKSLFNNEIAGKASSMLVENESGIKTALNGIIPTVLTGLLSKAASDDPQHILNMAKEAFSSGLLGNLGNAFGNSHLQARGGDLLKNLFGDKLGNVSSLISGYSGIRESSASSLMSIAGPAALGVLGKHAADSNMNAGSLLGFLNEQKDNILGALPSGLNLAGALGLGSLSGIGNKLSGKVSEFAGAFTRGAPEDSHLVKEKTGGSKWMPRVLGAILVLTLIIFISKGCGSDKNSEAVVTTDTAKSGQASTEPVIPARESLKVKLPDGIELDAYRGGIEEQLVIFLNNPASVAGKDVWFDFDNLNFNTGSAVLTEESTRQVQNINAILKAYPKLKIKIGGYTDKTGDSLNNINLSQGRANAVVLALKTSGASMQQVIGAEGYGSQYARAPADAPDADRQKDRRIAVGVRAK